MSRTSHRYPIGCTAAQDLVVIGEKWAGSPAFGRYIALASDRQLLATVTMPQTKPYDEIGQALAWDEVQGLAPLHYVGSLMYDGQRMQHDVLIEGYPDGISADIAFRLPLVDQDVRRIGRQIATICTNAHEHGIVLLTLRPQLIYMTYDPLDVTAIAPRAEHFFFTAEKADSYTEPVWRDCFLAPEFLLRQDVTPAADVFSLSAILATWLTGRHPFAGTSYQTKMASIMQNQRTEKLPDTELGAWIAAGLAGDPANRPALADLP